MRCSSACDSRQFSSFTQSRCFPSVYWAEWEKAAHAVDLWSVRSALLGTGGLVMERKGGKLNYGFSLWLLASWVRWPNIKRKFECNLYTLLGWWKLACKVLDVLCSLSPCITTPEKQGWALMKAHNTLVYALYQMPSIHPFSATYPGPSHRAAVDGETAKPPSFLPPPPAHCVGTTASTGSCWQAQSTWLYSEPVQNDRVPGDWDFSSYWCPPFITLTSLCANHLKFQRKALKDKIQHMEWTWAIMFLLTTT